jgi:hypothetical protein
MTSLIETLEQVAHASSAVWHQEEENMLELETSYVLDCVLAALDELGYAVVPKVPTYEMVMEGLHPAVPGSVSDIYREMIKAAPKVTL